MKTLTLIDQLLSNGLDLRTIVIVTETLANPGTFARYFGAVNANGKYSIADFTPVGVAVYDEENFIGSPDAVFDLEHGGKLAWYDYQP